MHTYVAESIGTFILSLAVLLSLAHTPPLMMAPVVAALVVGVFVYTIGSLSGAHLNPAVTVAAFTLRKITPTDALGYIIGQSIGAAFAFFLVTLGLGLEIEVARQNSFMVLVAEAVGTFILTFGIGAVMFGKVTTSASGLVIGGSLLLGILVAVGMGSVGILNPAVAFAIGSFNALYIFGPIIGGVLGMWTYRILTAEMKETY